MTTRAVLAKSVDHWMIRDDIAETGVDFDEIMLIAEAEIRRAVRCVVQEVSTTLVFTGRSADLPADYLGVREPFVDDNVRDMNYMTPQAIRKSGSWTNGRVGAFYTLEGNIDLVDSDDRVQMTIAGPATAANPLSVEVNYWRSFPALVNGTDTNWLLTNHYDIYLYAAIRAGCELTQEHTLEDRYAAKLAIALDQLRLHENRKRFGGSSKQAYNNPRAVI